MHGNSVSLPPMKAEAAAETRTQRLDMAAELADYRHEFVVADPIAS